MSTIQTVATQPVVSPDVQTPHLEDQNAELGVSQLDEKHSPLEDTNINISLKSNTVAKNDGTNFFSRLQLDL